MESTLVSPSHQDLVEPIDDTVVTEAREEKRSGTDLLLEFIQCYKDEPTLWKVKSKDYSNRDKRSAAYKRLLSKYKIGYPNSTLEDVKKKIEKLRSSFRKELKKVQSSKRSGASLDDVYQPTLWYYDYLLFLTDQETPANSICNLPETDGEEEADEECANDDSSRSTVSQTLGRDSISPRSSTPHQGSSGGIHSPSPTTLNLKRKSKNMSSEVLAIIKDKLSQPEKSDDYFDLVGKTWASKLRSLSPNMQIVAEKTVNDVFYDAQMGVLTCNRSYCIPHQPSTNFEPNHNFPSGSQTQPPTSYYQDYHYQPPMAPNHFQNNSSFQHNYHNNNEQSIHSQQPPVAKNNK